MQRETKDKRIKKYIKNEAIIWGKLVLILVTSILFGVVCLAIAYRIPLSDQTANVQESLRILEEEGWYPTIPYMKNFEGEFGTHAESPGILDNYTDELMIQTAVIDPKGDYLKAAMIYSYPRYWGGFVALLRPALLVLDYGEMRMLNILVQMLLIIILAMQLYKRKGKVWCFWIFSIYALLTPYVLGLSMQNSCIFYLGVMGTILLLWKEQFFEKGNRVLYLFFISGILTAYFDFLTYPLFVWALPVTVLIIIRNHNKLIQYLRDIITTGICWAFGYIGMWAGKWIVACLVLHIDMSQVLLDRIELHSVYGGTDIRFIDNLTKNLEKWINMQTICVLFAWFIWFLIMAVKRKGTLQVEKTIPLTIVSCGSLAWCFVMRYHTFEHAFFTHRIYSVTFCAVLAACICMMEETQEKPVTSRKVGECALVAGIAISFLLTMQCRKEFTFHNGFIPPQYILLEENSVVSETITPRYNYVKKMEIGLIAEEGEGEYLIRIYEGEKLLTEEIVPFNEVVEGKMYPFEINQRIKQNEFSLSIMVQNCKERKGYIYVTDKEYPLPECSEAQMDGNPLGGQLTQSLGYMGLPGLKSCLNYLLIIMGIVIVLFADGYYIATKFAIIFDWRSRENLL